MYNAYAYSTNLIYLQIFIGPLNFKYHTTSKHIIIMVKGLCALLGSGERPRHPKVTKN